MCRFMRLLGASLMSGNFTSSGGISGSSANAFSSFSISVCTRSLVSRSIAELSCPFLDMIACSSRHLSHLKSSISSTLKRPSKQLFNDVEFL